MMMMMMMMMFTVLFASVVFGQIDYFGFGFTDPKFQKRSIYFAVL